MVLLRISVLQICTEIGYFSIEIRFTEGLSLHLVEIERIRAVEPSASCRLYARVIGQGEVKV